MSVTVVIGAQWGDEGKGKVIDFLAQKANYIVRFHGGNNAGHTVINKYGTFPLHLIPSGIFSQKATAIISNGTVLDLAVLVDEIALLEKAKVPLKGRLIISPRCHIILPYHKLLDGLYEKAKGKNKTGTTGRGIGPVHADKVSYNGIRIIDLFDEKVFMAKLHTQLLVKNAIITALGEKPLSEKGIARETLSLFKKLQPFIQEPFPLLHEVLKKNKNILLEGAQGMFLDNDWGTYPFVTASTIVPGGSNAATGIPPQAITQVIAVTKAYTTRVGSGPFPTELLDDNGEKLRTGGHEFGTTTGRARRCGWFDAELIRFTCSISGITDIALTKLDVLDNFAEINICTGYRYKGRRVHYYDVSAEQLEELEPIYIKVKGWRTSTKGTTSFTKLPKLAQAYVKKLETLVGAKISLISTGPERNEIIEH